MVDSSVQEQFRSQLIECAGTGRRVVLHYVGRGGKRCVRVGYVDSVSTDLAFVGEGAGVPFDAIVRVELREPKVAEPQAPKDGAS